VPRHSEAADVVECGGRGLFLLQRFASRWGCDVHGGDQPFAKSVWFEFVV
jgi:hypothetical protein